MMWYFALQVSFFVVFRLLRLREPWWFWLIPSGALLAGYVLGCLAAFVVRMYYALKN